MAKQQKNTLSKQHWIVKSNTLNEIRNSGMTITQMRLFAVYLSKINPNDVTTREVKFTLDEYAKIIGLERFHITKLEATAADLLKVVITYHERTNDYDEKSGLRGFKLYSSLLFSRFELKKNAVGEWTVNINCHDDILPLLFELKRHFFRYQLWNSLHLASPNQIRMYEILKQYEYAGIREITVEDLREFLGIKPKAYTNWDNFRRRVLEPMEKALSENTDIKFTWEPLRQGGKGGKIHALKFNIEKNTEYINRYSLDEFLSEQKKTQIESPKQFTLVNEEEDNDDDFYCDNNRNDDEVSNDRVDEVNLFLSEACDDEFNLEQIQIFRNLLLRIVPLRSANAWQKTAFDCLKSGYDELNWRARQKKIRNRFLYLKKILEISAKDLNL